LFKINEAVCHVLPYEIKIFIQAERGYGRVVGDDGAPESREKRDEQGYWEGEQKRCQRVSEPLLGNGSICVEDAWMMSVGKPSRYSKRHTVEEAFP